MFSVVHAYFKTNVCLLCDFMRTFFTAKIRLTGEEFKGEGRLELFVDGVWGSVCTNE